jgi:hypothetical protein
VPTAYERIFRLKSDYETENAEAWLSELMTVASGGDQAAIKRAMSRLVPEYTPSASALSEEIGQVAVLSQ